MNCVIQGRNTICAGSVGTYTVTFYQEDGKVADDTIEAQWSLQTEISGVKLTSSGSTAQITVDDIDEVVGKVIILQCQDTVNKYNLCSFGIEVM